MDDRKALDKINNKLGSFMAQAAGQWALSAARDRASVKSYPERIVYPSGPRFSVTWKGSLTAYKLNVAQSANHQKPYFVNLHDPREMLAEDVTKLDEVDAEIKRLNSKRQRILKRAFERATPVPVEVGMKITDERNSWKPGAR